MILAVAVMPSSANAGPYNNAVAAIAQARERIESGDRVSASTITAGLQARAIASLADAELLDASGEVTRAIVAAQ